MRLLKILLGNKSIVALWEIWKHLEIDELHQDVAKQNRIVNTLKRLGWERAPNAIQHGGKRSKVWKKNLVLENGGVGVLGVSDAQDPFSESLSPNTPPDTPNTKEVIVDADDF
jgi:hypothetical protein